MRRAALTPVSALLQRADRLFSHEVSIRNDRGPCRALARFSGGTAVVPPSARRRGNEEPLVQADVMALPFASQSFALVTAFRVLSHIANIRVAFREIARVVQKGGHVLVTDVDPSHLYGETSIPGAHRQELAVETHKHDIGDLRASAGEAGLTIKQFVRLRAGDLKWLPSTGFHSIDRTGQRAIFLAARFQRVV